MNRLRLALTLGGFALTQVQCTHAPPSKPIKLLHVKVHQQAHQLGEPFVVATFSHRTEPLTVPLWVAIDPNSKQCDVPSANIIPVPHGRFLVRQDGGLMCDLNTICKLWHPTQNRWTTTSCPDITAGYYNHVSHITGDLYLGTGVMEGGSEYVLFRWESDDSHTRLLKYLTTDEIKQRQDGSLELLSSCDPKTGRSAGVFVEGAVCTQPDDLSCGYCDMMYGVPVRWSWREGERPKRLKD